MKPDTIMAGEIYSMGWKEISTFLYLFIYTPVGGAVELGSTNGNQTTVNLKKSNLDSKHLYIYIYMN